MHNNVNENRIVKENQNIIGLDIDYKNISLSRFPTVLKRCIDDWEMERQEQTNNKYFDAYDELSILMNLSVPTLRKWTNQYNPSYPNINQITQLCNHLGNTKPIGYIIDIWEKL